MTYIPESKLNILSFSNFIQVYSFEKYRVPRILRKSNIIFLYLKKCRNSHGILLELGEFFF